MNVVNNSVKQTFWHNLSSLRSANPRWRCSKKVYWLLKNPEASSTVKEASTPSSLRTPIDGNRRIFAANWSRSPGVENFQLLATKFASACINYFFPNTEYGIKGPKSPRETTDSMTRGKLGFAMPPMWSKHSSFLKLPTSFLRRSKIRAESFRCFCFLNLSKKPKYKKFLPVWYSRKAERDMNKPQGRVPQRSIRQQVWHPNPWFAFACAYQQWNSWLKSSVPKSRNGSKAVLSFD